MKKSVYADFNRPKTSYASQWKLFILFSCLLLDMSANSFSKKKNMRYDHLVEIISILNYLSDNEGSQNLNHTVTTVILTYKLFKIKFYVIIFDMHVLFVTDCGLSNMFFKCLIQNINQFQMTQYRIFQKII